MGALTYNGFRIRARGNQLSLTDMWRAVASPQDKDPPQWLRLPGPSEFIQCVADSLNMGLSHVIVAERGRYANTWAHWQIGLAYAKYLDPVFHMHVNEVYCKEMERRYGSLTIPLEEKLLNVERRVDKHDVRLDQHDHVLSEQHKLAVETHSNVIAIKQWQDRARLPQPRRFSDEDENICYQVVHLEFGGRCPIDRTTRLVDGEGKRIPYVSELDHWHGPQYNRIENAMPVSLAVHKKLTADPEFRAANAATFQHFHLMRAKLMEQGLLRRKKRQRKLRQRIRTESHERQLNLPWEKS